MNYITYKDQENINLDELITFFPYEEAKSYDIVFVGDHLRVTWRFSNEYERDAVLERVVSLAQVEVITLG